MHQMNEPVEGDTVQLLLADYESGHAVKELKRIYLMSMKEIRQILKENGYVI